MHTILEKLQKKADQLSVWVQSYTAPNQAVEIEEAAAENKAKAGKTDSIRDSIKETDGDSMEVKSEFDLQIERFREKARLLREGRSNQENEKQAPEDIAEAEDILVIEDYDLPEQEDALRMTEEDAVLLTEETEEEAEAAFAEDEPMEPAGNAADSSDPLEKPLYVTDPEQYAEIANTIREVLGEVTSLSSEMEEKLDAQEETIRNAVEEIKDSFQQQNETKLAAVLENSEALKQSADQLLAKQDDLSGKLDGLKEERSAMQAEIEDKIHTENVRSYRNLQELFKESDGKKDSIIQKVDRIEGQRKLIKAAIALGVCNLAGIAALILLYLGIF